jgi:uncharacterized membrane protein YozB (DUF420 family)
MVLSGPTVILILKGAVLAVTLLLMASLIALARGSYRWHGRINTVFFILTAAAVVGLELIVRLVQPGIFDYMEADLSLKRRLTIHLCFSVPATAVMALMLYTGYAHRRETHLFLAGFFSALWLGTFVTGIFFLPHEGALGL